MSCHTSPRYNSCPSSAHSVQHLQRPGGARSLACQGCAAKGLVRRAADRLTVRPSAILTNRVLRLYCRLLRI